MADAVPENRRDSLNVPWIDTVRFVQQLSHDLRNHLNAIGLQSAYLSELEPNPELKGEIKRLREMISGLTALLQNLSRRVAAVKAELIPCRASDSVRDHRRTLAHEVANERRAL